MSDFQKMTDTMYRLTLPYKDIYTTIYFLRGPEGDIMFDAASFPEDLEEYILPAMKKIGITGERLKYIFISHNHRDHSGCLLPVLREFPTATVVTRSVTLKDSLEGYSVKMPEDGEVIGGCFKVIAIPGHTQDSEALLDTRSGALITGDCLQGFGIFGSGTWACNITRPSDHLNALKKLPLDEINEIYAAHDYHPYGYKASGKEEIKAYIQACIDPLMMIREMIEETPECSDEEITDRFNEPKTLPTLATRVVTAMRAEMSASAEKIRWRISMLPFE